jgi:hydrogenase-4 component F
MRVLVVVVPLLPLTAGVLVAAAGWRTATAWAGPLAAAIVTGAGIALAVGILDDGPVTALDQFLRVDALSAYMVIVIGSVALVATSYGVGYVRAELEHGHTTARRARIYGVLVQGFVVAMLVAVLADNLGVLWVSVEATTIATAFLVGHRRTRASLEASWKYVVIGSVGVALAFLGTVLVYFASLHTGGGAGASLNWSTLVTLAPSLDPGVVRLALGLLVVGYGTKIGLAPMHTWLPDAHSEAPAPVSALMSGVLLSVAVYALLRYKVIADAALGPEYLRGLLLAGALLSLAVAASLLLAQRDYKRMLAYSSIEHMGLVALGVAIGTPLAVGAALLHILGHGIGKAVLFCSSGEILHATGTTEIGAVRGLLVRQPFLGGIFGLGVLALLGLPPFSLFASELAIARAGVADGLGWAVGVAFVLVLVIFAAMIGHALQMLLGEPDGDLPDAHVPGTDLTVRRTSMTSAVPLVVGLSALAVLGVSIWPIERLLESAAKVVTG